MCTDKDTRHPIEILAPEGPHKTISIAAEQAAPMADLAAFTEQLSSFVREDYYGDAPYELLVRSSQFSWNQYDQFAAVLLKAAHAAGVEQGIAEAAVQMYRDIFIDMAGEANTILSAIRASAADEEHKDMVSVLSIPCGSGKSTALTRLIHDVIRRDDREGLVIVTDSVERMNEYWKPEKDHSPFDDKPQNLPCKDCVAFAGEIYVLSYAGKKEVSAFTKEYPEVKDSGQLTPPDPSDIHTLLPPCAQRG